MNRTSLYVAFAAAFGTAALSVSAQAPAGVGTTQKIGVIEVNRVVQESAIGKESIARLQKLQAAATEDLSKREKELRDLTQKIQEQGKVTNDDAMEKLQRDYQTKAVDFKGAQEKAQREVEDSQKKEMETLEKRVMPVINEVAKAEGFALVFNKFQSGLLFADTAVDITNAVIAKFNTQIAAPAAKPAGAAAASAAGAPKKPAATPAPKK